MAESTHTRTYYVWMIAQNDQFAEALVSKMVRRGFTIGQLGGKLITKHTDNPACVVAMSVYRVPRNDQEKKEYTATGVHNEVTDVIQHVKGKFWGMVVSAAVECTWNIGNMNIKAEETRLDALKKAN